MAMMLARPHAAAGMLRRSTARPALRRPLSRSSRLVPRAVLPGVEHAADLAAHASSLHALHGGDLAAAARDLFQLADAGDVGDAVSAAAATAAAAAASTAADAAASSSSSSSGGTFGFLADGFEAFLKVLERGLESAGVPYSYGFAIILLTLLVKGATFPLSKKSMESTMAMQAVAPRVKELQARYANEPETLQLETARLYKNAGINPLAGCLPTLATIPVFIGLYRALTKAADEGLLTSGFFWIPSLGGPTSLAMRQAGTGLSWLYPFEDGHPPIGWHDAGAYLILPILLVISQWASQKLVSPKSDDPQQQQTQAILGFIPFMIGWFSLNVPSGLTLYWFVNNIVSTAMQVYMKRTIKVELPPMGAAGAGAGANGAGPVIDVSGTVIQRPKEERGASGRELGSRKRQPSPEQPAAQQQQQQQQPQSSRGQKFRARKSREAASRAATIASGGGAAAANGAAEAAPSAAPTATAEKLSVPDAPPRKD